MKYLAVFVFSMLIASNLLGAAEAPEVAAKRYGSDLGYTVLGVSCTQVDTDNDGYVTCTLRVQAGDKIETQSIQCAATRAVNADGCETQARHTEGCKPTPIFKQ